MTTCSIVTRHYQRTRPTDQSTWVKNFGTVHHLDYDILKSSGSAYTMMKAEALTGPPAALDLFSLLSSRVDRRLLLTLECSDDDIELTADEAFSNSAANRLVAADIWSFFPALETFLRRRGLCGVEATAATRAAPRPLPSSDNFKPCLEVGCSLYTEPSQPMLTIGKFIRFIKVTTAEMAI
uniref:Uncharacterized protein n=1 Tax=Romanomermis culicivorax TaxID=13658 RepID=A0A915KKQ3_ROMCU